MDERLKILLGDTDVITKDNEDLYININLNRSFFEYKKEKYDNDFDLAKQFEKERDASRNFRIYGVVDSNVIDCDNYPLKVYSDSGATDLVYTTTTTFLNFGGSVNVYNKKKGKYYIPLDNYTGSSIFIQVPTNTINITTQIFEQRLVFYNLDNEFISYGTETVEVDNDLNTLEINNNFPFFYNKHWVKKDLTLLETKKATVTFSNTGQTLNEGQTIQIGVELDKPSPFGNEKVDFVFDPTTSTADPSDFIVYCGTTTNIFPGTVQLQFSLGEQFKTINFQAANDFNVELFENFTFKLDNFISVKSGANLYNVINIVDQTPRQYAKYILSNMYENRSPYVGKTAYTYTTATYSTPSIFRNGLYYLGNQQEFYPTDTFDVDILNAGAKTLLPAGSGLGNATDQLWNAGETKTFTITPSYSTFILNEVQIYLPPILNNAIGAVSPNPFDRQYSIIQVINSININGFKMNHAWASYDTNPTPASGVSICYESLKQLLNGSVYDIYNIKGVPKQFSIIENASAYTITLIASSPGIRLDVDTNRLGIYGDGQISTATTTVNYSYPEQSPFEFKLLGNLSFNAEAAYYFTFKKKDHRPLSVLRNAVAGLAPVDNYLVTAYRDVLHNWDAPNNAPVAFSGDPLQFGFPANMYYLPKTDLYYEGLALLSGTDPYNPANSNLSNYGPSVLSLFPTTYWGPTIADSAVWSTTPLNKIPETYTKLSTQTKAQKGLMKIDTSTGHNSFDFRNGNTGPFTTFYWDNTYSTYMSSLYVGSSLKASGTTMDARYSSGLKYEIDLGGTFSLYVFPPVGTTQSITIPVGPIQTTNPSYLDSNPVSAGSYLPYQPTNSTNNNINYGFSSFRTMLMEAKTLGSPFEIDNVVLASTSNVVVYMPIAHNEILGVTDNPYNNLIGGFTITPP